MAALNGSTLDGTSRCKARPGRMAWCSSGVTLRKAVQLRGPTYQGAACVAADDGLCGSRQRPPSSQATRAGRASSRRRGPGQVPNNIHPKHNARQGHNSSSNHHLTTASCIDVEACVGAPPALAPTASLGSTPPVGATPHGSSSTLSLPRR
eukprot:4680857-Prymnesium_polylepis.2